ncbi:MAG TPA: GFA family protein [Steroidobacteraceae bacterium]|nr:GFA family protein [Steroidobacteraceae bacterium]
MAQYYCHCDDCQAVHAGAYACILYRTPAVTVLRGDTREFMLKTTPRTQCTQCGTFLFAEVPGYGVRGVNAALLPQGMFKPAFHLQCKFEALPIADSLPHFKGIPAAFGGSDELMQW